jgi:hypothetical protein
MRAFRRIVVPAVLSVLIAVPVAAAVVADPFGPVEVVHPVWKPWDLYLEGGPIVGVDSSGNALFATFDRTSGGDQVAVYERCGNTWSRTLVGAPADNFFGYGLRVAPDGTALVVWRADDAGGTRTYYSSVRPPGGAWGQPQVIVADDTVSAVQFAISDAGAAIAVWGDTSPAGIWGSSRPAGGVWGAPQQITAASNQHSVAMSATGDAVVVYRAPVPGDAWARYRPAGGSWGTDQLVLDSPYHDQMRELMAEFDGTGRAVALARFREFNDAIRVNVRGAGAAGTWGATDQVFDDDGDQSLPNPPPSFDLRNLEALVRHPQGALAVWTRQPTQTNFNRDIVVSRLTGASWDAPKAFDLADPLYSASAATDAAGELLLTATRDTSTGQDIYASIAPSLSAAWPDMTRISPPAGGKLYRTPVAGGGGTAFYLAWSVHGAGDGTEIISTKATGGCGTPTPTATPIATADPSPQPLPPQPTPSATPDPAIQSNASPSAIADFTSLPAASRCVRNRKLTVRFKKPPKGYSVKTMTVRVNGKKVATIKGAKLKKPLYLRKLPKGSFTVTVSIKLKKGKGLTERRRYRACR